ncbi:CHRromatin Organization MOdifier domain-containing protein [Cardiosporidium cionae]|uniref:CHRromatin Organization MOdifier domain-containing protein n=1 Tax=Cardiosporidium cionae TaxID=476202 RepID=A0ABQ7J743_9APIC|nr:CHRromatin Organization MOdifier domain-containing protein [Cardiosporidium cionae]|eukprot:KAF8819786.1 CHRromatin Organization MOdifier domain-containing protein [Cardiosporidium cionae]
METLAVYLTGFGKFQGQMNNPTSQLISLFSEIYHSVSRCRSAEPVSHDVLLKTNSQGTGDERFASFFEQNYIEKAETAYTKKNAQVTHSKEEMNMYISSKIEPEPKVDFTGINLCCTEVLEVSVHAVSEAIPRIHEFMRKYQSIEFPACNTALSCKDSVLDSNCTVTKLCQATTLEENAVSNGNLLQESTKLMTERADSIEWAAAYGRMTTASNLSDLNSRSPLSVEYGNEDDATPSFSLNEEKVRLANEMQSVQSVSENEDSPNLSYTIADKTLSKEIHFPLWKENSGSDKKLLQYKPHKRNVIIHFGVDSGCSCIKLESVAFNEATFAIPDEQNFKPTSEVIILKGYPNLHTTLPVKAIAEELNGKGLKCDVSFDPGRFLCNYAYYLSLHQVAKTNIPVLFVHVPPFNRFSIEKQLEFVSELLQCLRRVLI